MVNETVNEITKQQFDEKIQSFIQTLNEKRGVSKEEASEFFNRRYDMLPSDVKESYIKSLSVLSDMAKMHYKKVMTQLETFEVVFIGVSQPTDYGLSKVAEDCIKAYKTDKQSAINKGLTNETGEPLYQKGANIGKVINMDTLWSKTFLGVVNDEGKGKRFRFNVREKALTEDIPLFKKVKVQGWKSKNSTETEILGGSSETNIEIISNETVELEKYLDLFEEECNTSIEDLADRQNAWNDFFIIKCDVNKKQTTNGFAIDMKLGGFEQTKSLDSVDLDLDDENIDISSSQEYYGFCSVEPDVVELGFGCYVIGTSYRKQGDNSVGVNVYGVWSPSQYRPVEVFGKDAKKSIDKVAKSFEKPKKETSVKEEPKKEEPKVEKKETKKDTDTDW